MHETRYPKSVLWDNSIKGIEWGGRWESVQDWGYCLQWRRLKFDTWVKIPWRKKWHPTPVFVMDRGDYWATVCGVPRVRYNLATKPPTTTKLWGPHTISKIHKMLWTFFLFFFLTICYLCNIFSWKNITNIMVFLFLCMCAKSLSCLWLFVTPWAVACQAPLSMGILQARTLEWVAMSSSKLSSPTRDWTQVSHIKERFYIFSATGKPKYTETGNLSLFQGIFLAQESN